MSPLVKRLLVLVVVVALVFCFFLFELDAYLSLSELKHSREALAAFIDLHPLGSAAVYLLIYIAVTGLSLPGAVPVSLAGGALFGLWQGVVLASLGSTTGAALACLVARYLLRDWVQSRFGPRLKRIDSGLEREGALYLFTLRLIPIFPFFLINLAMGLTRIPLWTFVWVSWMGMLPATFVFVNAGKELGRLDSVAGILSPSILLSFALLGLFPLAARRLLGWYRRSRGHGQI
ncbi:MAG: TVP38/TMEM64 family protein [Desulfovibrionaceae bacterium]